MVFGSPEIDPGLVGQQPERPATSLVPDRVEPRLTKRRDRADEHDLADVQGPDQRSHGLAEEAPGTNDDPTGLLVSSVQSGSDVVERQEFGLAQATSEETAGIGAGRLGCAGE